MTDKKPEKNIEFITNLVKEFAEQRKSICDMIAEVDKIKEHIDKLFPESVDKRYIRLFEERVKAMTGIFNTLLDMRKEITRSLKEEIEMRRRIEKDEMGDDANIESMIDIGKLVKAVEKQQKNVEKLKVVKK